MGESDKMSSDSVTNRECRAVPTPNVKTEGTDPRADFIFAAIL